MTDTYTDALVLGLGRSGEAAASLLLDEGVSVVVADSGDSPELRDRAGTLRGRGATVALGAGSIPELQSTPGVCVVSPGIPADSEWVRAVRAEGIDVIPELELGMRRVACPVLAVTGTNGKSTMVKLCSESLQAAGLKAVPGGNYGTPLSAMVSQSSGLDWIVAEVSSFQLEIAQKFTPAAAVLLNIQPDHLDRHPDMAAYSAIKLRMFADMLPESTGVLPTELAAEARACSGQCRWLTFGDTDTADAMYADGGVRLRTDEGQLQVSVRDTMFANGILGLTAAAAVAAMRACGIDPLTVERVARGFVPLPHRLEEVCIAGEVRFVDDSKATNLAAMEAALRACPGPVRLVAGGLLKEDNLDWVKDVLARSVSAAYLIGDAAAKFDAAWCDAVSCRLCGDLETATREAWTDARQGETILLSPGCASFDQFTGYDERGNLFAALAREIAAGEGDKRGLGSNDDNTDDCKRRREES